MPGAREKDTRVNEFTLTFQLKRAAPPPEVKPIAPTASSGDGHAAPPAASAKKGSA